MTTTARPVTGQPSRRTPGVLLVAGLCVVAAVLLTVVAAALTGDRADVLGALVGGCIAFSFFVFGSLVVTTATRIAPQAALVVALMTYTLQVVLVALVFAGISSSAAIGATLTAAWLAGGVVTATVAWTVGLLVAARRVRIPVYDIELPGSVPSRSVAEPASLSKQREVGAP